MTPHTTLAGCRDEAMDCLAVNAMQARALFDPSPETDSLAEHLIALRHDGVPERTIRELLTSVRALLRLNAVEAHGERDLVGTLDDLASTAHAASRAPRTGRPVTVKQLAQLVRAAQDDGSLEMLLTEHPRARLSSRSLLHELGVGRGARLMAALGEADRQPAPS